MDRSVATILFVLLLIQTSRGEHNNGNVLTNPGSCMLDGKVYQDKQEFVTKDCALLCICDSSKLTCKTSCPIVVGQCPLEHKIEFLKVEMKNAPGCRCPQKRRCILGGPNAENKYSLSYINGLDDDQEIGAHNGSSSCHADGNVYQPGEQYVTKDCKAVCVCNTSFVSCIPLCKEKRLDCPVGFRLSSVREPVAVGSSCSCDTPTCHEE